MGQSSLWSISWLHRPYPYVTISICALHLQQPSDWNSLHTALWCIWSSNASLKDADPELRYSNTEKKHFRFQLHLEPAPYLGGGVWAPEVTGQTKIGSKAHNDRQNTKDVYIAWIGVTGAPPWSKGWGLGSQASAWCPGLCPRNPEHLSWCRRLSGTG